MKRFKIAMALCVIVVAAIFCIEPMNLSFASPDSCVVVETVIDFGEVNCGAVEPDTVTITCADDDTLHINVTGLSSPYSFVSGNGADTLYQDSTATVIFQYAPTAAGVHTDTIDVGLAACDNSIVTGTGIAAECSLSVSSINCGDIAIGVTYLDTITIYNTEGDTIILNVSGLSGDYAIDSGSGADTLLAGENKDVIVSFDPPTIRAISEATDTLVMGSSSECDSIILTATSYVPVYPSDQGKYVTAQDALNRIAESNRWASQIIYDGHDITSADTTFLSTGWSRSDGGKIFLQINTADVAHSGGEPLLTVKMVEEDFWNLLYLQSNAADPTDTLVIGDGANGYNVWVVTGYGATLKDVSERTMAFGDSICVICIPDDASAGTIHATVRFKKE